MENPFVEKASEEKNNKEQKRTVKKPRRAARKAASYSYISQNRDNRMKFNNEVDPIYVVFNFYENRSVMDLTKDFIKDSIFQVKNLLKFA